MAAWNRWCATVVTDGAGLLHPVAHLTLRDPAWLESQLAELLSSAGVRLGMIAPAAVDGRPLSHPDLDPLWAAFVHHGVTPVFHVADQPRIHRRRLLHRSGRQRSFPPSSRYSSGYPPAIAITDLIVNGSARPLHPSVTHRNRRALVDLGSPVPA
jgi:hypothetical protein